MNYKIIVASLLMFSFSNLAAVASCPEGNPQSTDYIRRKPPNRCEGLIENLSGNTLNLISIATRNLSSFGETLTLQIPQINGGKNPQVIVKSLDDSYHYQLDDLLLSKNGSRFSFSWDTYVLRQAKIPANKLRAVASYNLGSQPVYVPVILGQSSGKYEFAFYSDSRVKFNSFKILSTSQETIYETKQPNPKKGETTFTWDGTWDGRNAPAGRYQLRYVAFIERRNENSDRIQKSIVFEHNPNWLK